MGYYKNNNRNNHNHHKSHNTSHHGQSYVWVVYNWKQARYHTFTSKVQALKYYYNNSIDCSSPEKRDF